MSLEILKSIKQTEDQAEDLQRQSLDDSRQILSEASNQSYKLQEQAIEDAEKDAKDILLKAEKLANTEIKKLQAEVDKECEEIKNHARKKLDKAVEIIMGRVVNIYGNS